MLNIVLLNRKSWQIPEISEGPCGDEYQTSSDRATWFPVKMKRT